MSLLRLKSHHILNTFILYFFLLFYDKSLQNGNKKSNHFIKGRLLDLYQYIPYNSESYRCIVHGGGPTKLFETEFLIALLSIIAIDIVLGGDNAIVIALASRNLPESQRNKAILFGTALAIIVRILLTIVAVYLLMIPYLRLVGGILLIYIAYKLLVDQEDEANITGGTTIGSAIKTIVFADLVMAFDNVIAVAGAAQNNIYLVIFGLLFSIPIIIGGSKIILYSLERFPILIYAGAGILAFTAAKMIVHEEKLHHIFENQVFSYGLQATVIIGTLVAGYIVKKTKIA
jgi:YjbE family integral membrane protein